MTGIATGQAIKFQVFADPALVEGVFDAIEVWRSRELEEGPYEQITAALWESALHLIDDRSYILSGKQLKLRVDEINDVTVTFSGSDPLSSTTLTSQIQLQGLGLVRSSVLNGIRIETSGVGAARTLRVLESDAAALLGLSMVEPDAVAFGHDAWMLIVSGTEIYTLVDPHGSSAYFYKVRFRNRLNNTVSDFSPSFSGEATGGVDPAQLVRGFVKLVDLNGRPMANQNVLIYNSFKGAVIGEQTVIGGSLLRSTDASGEIEVFLPRGLSVIVALSGTSLVRDIVVPTDPDVESFNLLDPDIGTDDVFKVQVPDIQYAERRSL